MVGNAFLMEASAIAGREQMCVHNLHAFQYVSPDEFQGTVCFGGKIADVVTIIE